MGVLHSCDEYAVISVIGGDGGWSCNQAHNLGGCVIGYQSNGGCLRADRRCCFDCGRTSNSAFQGNAGLARGVGSASSTGQRAAAGGPSNRSAGSNSVPVSVLQSGNQGAAVGAIGRDRGRGSYQANNLGGGVICEQHNVCGFKSSNSTGLDRGIAGNGALERYGRFTGRVSDRGSVRQSAVRGGPRNRNAGRYGIAVGILDGSDQCSNGRAVGWDTGRCGDQLHDLGRSVIRDQVNRGICKPCGCCGLDCSCARRCALEGDGCLARGISRAGSAGQSAGGSGPGNSYTRFYWVSVGILNGGHQRTDVGVVGWNDVRCCNDTHHFGGCVVRHQVNSSGCRSCGCFRCNGCGGSGRAFERYSNFARSISNT